MRVLMVQTNIGYGGASKMMASVANALCEKHDVTFLTFRSDVVLQQLDPRVVHIHDELYKNSCKPIEMIGQIWALHRYLAKERFDIAIAFLHPSHYMLTLAAIGTGTKVVLSERGDPFSRKKQKNPFVHIVEHIIHYADAYVFQSQGAMMGYPKRCREKGRVIVNALPEKILPEYDVREAKKVIAHVARFELIQKRQDVMLQAFAKFHSTHPDYSLHFVGDGPDEELMKEYAKELGVEADVVFHGAQNDVYQILKQSSIFVLTSDYEGLPNALLEAMRLGVPCISTDCSPGGARMVIEDGVNGYIVPCGAIDLLCRRICELADSAELRELFSERAPLIKERFSMEKVNEEWNSFVESLNEGK